MANIIVNEKNNLHYIAGAFSPNAHSPLVTWNVAMAQAVAHKYLMRGIPCFVPHANFGWLAMEAEKPTYEEVMAMCLVILARCDTLVVCPNSDYSVGTMTEHAYAKTLKMPIIYEKWQEEGTFKYE